MAKFRGNLTKLLLNQKRFDTEQNQIFLNEKMYVTEPTQCHQ